MRLYALRLYKLLLCASLLASAQAARVTVADTKLTVDIPAGFQKMDAATIATKYARGNAPKVVYTTPDTLVNIAFSHNDKATLPPGKVNSFGEMMSKVFQSQVPGLKYIKKGPTKLAGRNWYEMEFNMKAADQSLYNHLLVSSEGGKALIVTVNAPSTQLAKYKSTLDTSLKSLK